MTRTRWALLAALTLAFAGCAQSSSNEQGCSAPDPSVGDTSTAARLCTNHGDITLELYANQTPQTVQNFGTLAQDGYYNDTRFHRVIEDFMIQGGDPNTRGGGNESSWGAGGPGYTIEDEFACEDGTISNDFTGYREEGEPCDGHGGLALTHDGPGVVSMANRGEPRTGGSQFFITVGEAPHLDGTHPVFATVVEGMDVVMNISTVPTEGPRDSRPQEDVVLEGVVIGGELPGVQVEKFNEQ